MMILFVYNYYSKFFYVILIEYSFETKRTRQTYTRHQAFELEKEFFYTK